MNIEFIENIERDMRNWREAVKSSSYGMDWKDFLPSDFLIDHVNDEKYLKNYLMEKFYNSGNISDFKKWLENNVNSSQIEKDLENLIGKDFPCEKVKVFITTFRRCPYNPDENFFYIKNPDNQKLKKLAIKTIYHELMHFFFHKYYLNIFKEAELDDRTFHKIKESFTVLLNPTLEQRNLPLDKGYLEHQEIRKYIEKSWEESKDKNFDKFVEKIISDYKAGLICKQIKSRCLYSRI